MERGVREAAERTREDVAKAVQAVTSRFEVDWQVFFCRDFRRGIARLRRHESI